MTLPAGTTPFAALANTLPSTVTPTVAPAQVDAGGVRSEDAYTLGAGDRVRIDVFRVAQYSGENQVLVDGTVNMPDVGSVSVQGLTLAEAATAISKRYSRLLRYPTVTVTLLTPRPVKVGITGEVSRPGTYTLAIEGGSLPTVTRALQTAGGITQSADLRQIQVRRPRAGGGDDIIQVDLWEFLKNGDLRRDITLRGGDTIVIPTASEINLAESRLMASVSFSADRTQALNIVVVGEVYRPGSHTVTGTARTGAAGVPGGAGGGDRNPTITRAIQVAGGIKPLADIRKIEIRRLSKTGAEQKIQVDLWSLLKTGDIQQDVILQDGDTIAVPTVTTITPSEATQIAAASFSPDTIRVNVVGEVRQPGVVQVPPNTPLTRVLLAAGGFNTRASQGSVDLVRLNSDGTVTRRTIGVDFALGVDENSNPPLRNDDVLIVSPSTISTVSDTLGTILGPIGGFFSIFNFFRIFGF